MENCENKIANDIMNSICESYGKGVDNTAYLIALDDIEGGKPTITDGIISSITLNSGARAYKMYMPAKEDPYSGIVIEQQDVSIGNSYTKTTPIKLIHDTSTNARNVEVLAIKKHLVIVKNSNYLTDGSNAFFVIGAQNGVVASNATLDKYSDDSAGGWSLDLIETDATLSQVFFFADDYDGTISAIESLVAPEEEETDSNSDE